MADATAAEATQSASRYDQAREQLSGYRIILDLLAVEHFGFPKAPILVQKGSNLDLRDRERFLGSLDNDRDRQLVERVEHGPGSAYAYVSDPDGYLIEL